MAAESQPAAPARCSPRSRGPSPARARRRAVFCPARRPAAAGRRPVPSRSGIGVRRLAAARARRASATCSVVGPATFAAASVSGLGQSRPTCACAFRHSPPAHGVGSCSWSSVTPGPCSSICSAGWVRSKADAWYPRRCAAAAAMSLSRPVRHGRARRESASMRVVPSADRHLRLRRRRADGRPGNIDQLPYEHVVYLGDTAHVPYGPQPLADVRGYALACLDDLVEQGVKMLVIACNTASRPCPRRPGALRRPGRRGDPARGPSRRRRHPHRPGRGHRHAATPPSGVPRRLRRGAAVDGAFPSPARTSWTSSRRGITAGRAAGLAEDVSSRCSVPAGHAGPGLHPLPVARPAHRPGHGRPGHLGVQRRRDRQGRVRRADPPRTRPRPTSDEATHRFWTTGHPEAFAGIGRRLMGADLIGVEQFAATPRPSGRP